MTNSRQTNDRFGMARKISIQSYLSSKGIKVPQPRTNGTIMMQAFYRNDTNPSLQIDTRKNTFYDFGSARGGSVIDLVMAVENCNAIEAVNKLLRGQFNHYTPMPSTPREKAIELIEIKPLYSKVLLAYLWGERKIPDTIARKFCKLVRYRVNGSQSVSFGIGFEQVNRGYAVRNKAFKICIGEQSYSLIQNGGSRVFVFEGFIDFLTFATRYSTEGNDFLILNSTTNLHKAKDLLKGYKSAVTYLDNDPTGRSATAEIIAEMGSQNVINMAQSYSDFNDYNDWHVAQTLKQNE